MFIMELQPSPNYGKIHSYWWMNGGHGDSPLNQWLFLWIRLIQGTQHISTGPMVSSSQSVRRRYPPQSHMAKHDVKLTYLQRVGWQSRSWSHLANPVHWGSYKASNIREASDHLGHGGWATPLKNISQLGSFLPIYGKKKTSFQLVGGAMEPSWKILVPSYWEFHYPIKA